MKNVIFRNILHIPHYLEYKFANQLDLSSVTPTNYQERKINTVAFKQDDIIGDNIIR